MLVSLLLACSPSAPESSVPDTPTPAPTPVATPPATPTPPTQVPTTPTPPTVSGFQPSGDAFVAEHPASVTTTTVTASGASFAGPDWALTLTPSAYGRGEALQPFISTSPREQAGRVAIGNEPVMWFHHDTEGLEFGFDIAQRLDGDEPLVLHLAHAGLSQAYGRGSEISFSAGDTLVRIDELSVRDANDTLLTAGLSIDCGPDDDDAPQSACAIAITIDDLDATYPLVVDPTVRALPLPPSPVAALTVAELSPGDLVITEMMIDPIVSDADGEWFEIHNTTSETIELDGLAIWDDATNYFLIPDDDLEIEPGGYFVMGRSNASGNGGHTNDLVISNFQLANGPTAANPEEVVIGIRATNAACGPSNPCVELDRVVITSGWRYDAPGAPSTLPNGATLALDPSRIAGDNNDRSSWCDGLTPYGSVGMFGTPGQANDSCAFDLPFQYTWDLVGGAQVTDCTVLEVELGDAMTTQNGGVGTYARYTGLGGQSLSWSYGFAEDTTYLGVRGFGAANWTLGGMTAFDESLAEDGSWVSPCPDIPDTGEPPGEGRLLFTQYLEGATFNKYLEIQNVGDAPMDLSDCQVRQFPNGSTTPSVTLALALATSVLDPGEFLLLCHAGASESCDIENTSLNFNGDDALELSCGSETIDVIGQIGFDPGSEWGNASIGTRDDNLLRSCAITQGDSNGSDAFDPSIEWVSIAPSDVSDLRARTCP